MDITINKETSIDELVNYLKINRHNLTDTIANILRSNFKTVGDIYNISYQELSTIPGIAMSYSTRLATIFIINDYSNSRNSNFIKSLLSCKVVYHTPWPVLKKYGLKEKFHAWLDKLEEKKQIDCSNRFALFVKYLDKLNKKQQNTTSNKQSEEKIIANKQTQQETLSAKQSKQTDDKSFRLIQQLLKIWNDDVEHQVEDIINQSK